METSVDLFGCKVKTLAASGQKKPKNLFDDYDGFVEKFELKKTTDDCYTPSEVFDCILEHVVERCGIQGREIVRPFFPGGDFENADYPEGCVVLDNPPFSIISKIARFYVARNIDFFLFAPHLTLFGSDIDCTGIVVGGDITYENGAVVKTSFLSNMFGDARVIGDAELYEKLQKIKDSRKVGLPKYHYPANVLTVSMVHSWVLRGISVQFDKDQLAFCRALADQKKHGKAIFGSGFLISEKAAAEKAAAEKAAAEKANVVVWGLSEREREIIKSLK